ncbi:MAG: alanine racemase [Deltaproteobacteria bacterium]|nr:alanine racemase [Deltaproteobacteria bacterium]
MTPLPKGRPTVCLIDLGALRWNHRQVRSKVGSNVKILSVVKANAYGHGACEAAAALEDEGTDGFGTATVEEAIELRDHGIRSPIVILAGVYPDQYEEIEKYDLTPVICDLEVLRKLKKRAAKRKKPLNFHLKVDTGMGRIGLLAKDAAYWIPELNDLGMLQLEGVLSHFSRAENVSHRHTRKQLDSFAQVLRQVQNGGHQPRYVHLSNSAAIVTLSEAHFTMVRPGLMLYGIYPSPEMANETSLKPVLTWKTFIHQLKKVPKGFSISYGQTFTTKRESLIATLPLGYADGYKRSLSNRGAVLVRGQRAPIVGTVCMDLTMVDVTDIRGVIQGDEVVLLGRQQENVISADEMASWSDTISYEVLTSISARVPRIHKK